MSTLLHIVEPVGLYLTWQPQDEQAKTRTRRVVADIRRDSHGSVVFRYLKGTTDFKEAEMAGFKGFPAVDIKSEGTSTGVLEALLRRLPPRKREDFSEFLALHRLPHPFAYSDFALLGYTGARLPSDGFSLVPIFPEDVAPCDYIIEIAGFRHADGADVSRLSVGERVSFSVDAENPVDQDAIGIVHGGIRIGYVNRALKDSFGLWMKKNLVTGTIERLNGKPERPLVYVRVSIR